jgi:hypothetical protein
MREPTKNLILHARVKPAMLNPVVAHVRASKNLMGPALRWYCPGGVYARADGRTDAVRCVDPLGRVW